ncbi:MFS transporter [Nocardioides sp. DS6]|uniref:MFS transporter n=1 Tax=Nocardioides eburneus TaxID=3231482 RepID=A0ABV3SYK4_9ACTN
MTATEEERTSVSSGLFLRLTAMMLLEFVVFGSWFATFGLILATHGLAGTIGHAYSLAAVAAIVSPMFLGSLGDRFVQSQKGLGAAHLAGGATMLLLPAAVAHRGGGLTLTLIFVYMLFFQPTLGLTNHIAFRHLGTHQRLFPYIRVFGTLGWFIAGQAVGWMGLSASPRLFFVTAGVSLAFGLYAFTLPRTQPPAKGVRFQIGDVVGAKAFTLFRHRNFAVLMVCALFTAVALGVYNTYASPFLGALGVHDVASVLSLGQASEVAFIVTIPWVLRYIGIKWALFSGMVMWSVRLALFIVAAGTHDWVAILAIALQGICNDFFLVLAAMYIGTVAPVRLSAQAQGMLILITSGIGQFIGAELSGRLYDATVAKHPASDLGQWTALWILPVVSGLVAAVIWAAFFRHGRSAEVVRYHDDASAELVVGG